MIKPLAATFTALLCLSSSAFANPAFNKAVDEAIEITDPKMRAQSLTPLLSKAQEPDSQLLILYHIGVAKYESELFGEAIHNLEKALKIHDEHYGPKIGQRDAIVSHLNAAFTYAGRSEDASTLVAENLSRKDDLLSDIWAKTPQGLVHRQTSVRCDNAVFDIVRTATNNFSAIGQDVGCDYKFLSEHYNKISLYMSVSGGSGEANHDAAAKPMKQNWKGSEVIADKKSAGFTVASGTPVLYTLLRNQNAGGRDAYSGAWTSVISGWVVKARITWDAQLGQGFGDKYASQILGILPAQTAAQIQSCTALVKTPQKPAPVKDDALEMLILSVMADPKTLAPERPKAECLMTSTDDQQVFLAQHFNSDRLFTLDGTAITQDVFVAPYSAQFEGIGTLDTGNGYYAVQSLETIDKPAEDKVTHRFTLYKVYESAPSAQQAAEDFIQAYNGDAPIYGSINYLEGGGTEININPDLLDDKDDEN